MATKKMQREELRGITKRQMNIIQLRKKLNTPDPNAVHVFTKYKIITYIFVIVFPPYALYRLWSKKTEFNKQEKMVQTVVSLIYMYLVIMNLIGG
ncbi:MAG: hypothetical protein ACK5LC_03250 [Coprobacillaceae bacterium]